MCKIIGCTPVFVTVRYLLIPVYIYRLEAAVLDLVADDSSGLQKQKSVYHWDKVLETVKY